MIAIETRRLFLGIIFILTLIISSCKSASPLPEGTLSNSTVEGEPELVLMAGHYQSITTSGNQTIVEEEGSYAVKGNQITFSMEKGSDILLIACGSTTVPYTYKWSYDQQTRMVKFINVNDPCDTRQSRRESGSWVLKVAVAIP